MRKQVDGWLQQLGQVGDAQVSRGNQDATHAWEPCADTFSPCCSPAPCTLSTLQPGRLQAQRPLQDPLIFGNYNVAYVSMGDRQYGQPAGGRFRGGLGKLLFRTTLLAQSVLKPDVVTNKVRWCWGRHSIGTVTYGTGCFKLRADSERT